MIIIIVLVLVLHTHRPRHCGSKWAGQAGERQTCG